MRIFLTLTISLLAGSIILIVVGVAWLSIVLLVSIVLFWIGYSDFHGVARFRNKRWISYPLFFLTIVFFSIGIRLFIIEIYAIPSGSMEDTLLPGDKIVMSKLSYGPRLPSTPFEIPWVNIAFFLSKKQRLKADSVWWNYKRLNGFSKIKHSDIVVFISTKNREETLIKRCMGLPGDTLLISDGNVFANNIEISEEGTLKLISRILFNNCALASSLFDSLGLVQYRYNNKTVLKNSFSTPLNNNQKQELLENKCIDSIIIERVRPDTAYRTFPKHELFNWSIDNFGPLVVPSKGMAIQLNEKNFILYNKVINTFELANLTTSEGLFFINGKGAEVYTFKNNYYFMIGDNRHNSNDSRYWGFVPGQNISGKAVLVLFSNGEEGFRWGRLLKLIR